MEAGGINCVSPGLQFPTKFSKTSLYTKTFDPFLFLLLILTRKKKYCFTISPLKKKLHFEYRYK